MAVYQDKAKDRIKKGLRRMTSIVEKGRAEDFKEADTRKIVSDILCEYLGWDRFDNVTAEQMIGSRFADYVVRTSDEEVFVVEVKQIGLKLKETHLNQARIALSGENLADHIISTEVINKLRIAIKNTTGQNLKNSEIAEALISRLFLPEKVTDDSRKAIAKMKKDERKKPATKSKAASEEE